MDDEEQQRTEEHSTWADEFADPLEALKRVALAGIGAVAVATEATDEMFQVLVRKGQETREDALREFREARQRNADSRSDSERYVRARMDALLDKVNLASKGDIEALNAKLNIITRKLDEVNVRSGEAPVSEPPVTPEQPRDAGSL